MKTDSFRKLASLTGLCLSLLASVVTAQGDALDRWTTIQVSTNSFGLLRVAYGQGRYVAFGEYSDWGVSCPPKMACIGPCVTTVAALPAPVCPSRGN